MINKINLQLVDDHPAIRFALLHFLENSPFHISSVAENATQAIEQFGKESFQGIILDLYMYPDPGEAVLEFHRSRATGIPILIYTATMDTKRIRSCLDLGAKGFLLKLSSIERLLEALQTVFVERRPYTDHTLGHISSLLKESEPDFKLSPREIEVTKGIAQSKSSKQIAETLGISENTVSVYRSRLMKKLGVNDSAGVTRFAIAAGLIPARDVRPLV